MNKKTILASVIIGNLILVLSLNIDFNISINEKKFAEINYKKSIQDDLICYLYDKGIDKDSASKKVQSKITDDFYLISSNIEKNIPEINYSDIISYSADRILSNKTLNLTTYAGILNLYQRKINLSVDEEVISNINKTLNENNIHNIIS